jgi:hypothetical protein
MFRITLPQKKIPLYRSSIQTSEDFLSTTRIVTFFGCSRCIVPLFNVAYIDKIDSKLDKNAYIFVPLSNVTQKNIGMTNNFSQIKPIPIIDITSYPSMQYICSKIEEVLRYSMGKFSN